MLMPLGAGAQRIQQKLGRGVVATLDPSSSSSLLVSWRKLAQEPEDCTYNIYIRKSGATEFTKLNSDPIEKTCYATTLSAIPYNTEIAVTLVDGDTESELSAAFTLEKHDWKDVYFEFDFETEVLYPNNYSVKYAWPMDLDGDGEIDALLVDRNYTSNDEGVSDPNCSTTSDKLQVYKLDGTCLWTADMGMNVDISQGQNDMVTAYDINCDGITEVIIRSSDGTRFWDQEAGDWGAYVNGAEDGDTDGDGIVNYRSSSSMNPPYFVTILDGNTGAEITSVELDYSSITDGTDQYSRTNRSDYCTDNEGTEYAFLQSKFVICYFDGIHPSLGVQCYDRSTSSGHHYYVLEWKYDWVDGQPTNWHHAYTWCMSGTDAAEFHQCRVCDVDGDGIDELMEGGYAVNSTQGLVMSPGIGHGDRFDVSDIDPDRPGIEVFAIQQSNLLGQIIYDAATGEPIKEWYLSTIGDVGRGRCIDVDGSVKGYEVFSTMDNLYDCKGNVITEGSTSWPYEAIWWNGDLQREQLSSPGGSNKGTNVMITTYGGSRLIQFSSESSWAVHAVGAVRPAFMGDIIGDWREEVILFKQDDSSSTGLIGYSTNIETDYSMYCLQEDPHYRLDCTGRGYYQMPCTGFYLGGDMPYPPLPPVMVADLRYASGSAWSAGASGFTTYDQTSSASYADGKSVIFDMSGDNSSAITLTGTLSPSAVYLMNPKGYDYTFEGSGTLAGDMELWKSMQGTSIINNNLDYTGKTVISEGTLELNGTVAGPIEIRAKGSLAGTGTFNGDITFEGALNYEGCRLMPGSTTAPYGAMTFGKSLTLPGVVYIEAALNGSEAAKISVNGDLTLEHANTINIDLGDTFNYDEAYVVAECTGALTADLDSISVLGLDGLNYTLSSSDTQLLITIHSTRSAETGVSWTGAESAVWNYKTTNFELNDEETTFVSGDEVIFTDDSDVRDITINETMTPGGITFDFDEGSYTFSGDGAIGGDGGLTLNGEGEVVMNLTANSYTGATTINAGTLTITSLADGGKTSSIGAAAEDEGYLVLNGGTLNIDALNMATNRIVNINDTATINVANSSAIISLTGIAQGDGYLIKDGPGQLNFCYEGENPFAGLILKQGKIAQGAWNSTFGKTGSPMILAGGTVELLDVNNSSTRPIFNYKTTVEEGTENTIIGTTRGAVNGTFYGTGTVTIKSTGVRSDVGANFAAFEGTLIAYGENFRLQSNVTDMRGTDVIMDEGSIVGHYASNGSSTQTTTTRMGSLSSTATDCKLGQGVDTYLVGYNDKSTTYKGILQAKIVKKYGEGTWTLTSSESTCPVTVVEGTLQLYNNPLYSTPTAFSTGVLTVQSGGTVTGTGGASSIVVESGGMLSAGYNGGYGTLKATGDVTLEEGSTIKVKVGAYSNGTGVNDKFKFNGTLTHSGDTILIVVDDARTLSAGDELTIFNGSGESTGSYVIVTQCADGREIYWDDSALLSDGVLTVFDVITGISRIEGDSTEVDVYSLDGKKLRSSVKYGEALDGLSSGVYLINGQKVVKK